MRMARLRAVVPRKETAMSFIDFAEVKARAPSSKRLSYLDCKTPKSVRSCGHPLGVRYDEGEVATTCAGRG